MEANKADALECLSRAESMLGNGNEINRKSAINLLQKSIRLYPTDKARKFLDHLMSTNNLGERNRPESNATKTKLQNGRTSESVDDEPSRTDEQKSAMERVRNGKTLYDMLGVSKTATYSEIVKSYRKLALLLHPDKNKGSGASDCFKAVARSFKVLSDDKSRSEYDISLSNPFVSSDRQRTTYRRNTNVFNVWTDDDDFSAEEFFNSFFGRQTVSGYGFPARYSTRRSTVFGNNTRYQEEPNFFKYVAMIGFVVFMVLSMYMMPNQSFRFAASSTYNARRTTSNLKIVYFVDPAFQMDRKDMDAFENEVEVVYLSQLERQCQEETQTRFTSIATAKLFGSANSEKQAMQMKTPSCDRYRILASKAG